MNAEQRVRHTIGDLVIELSVAQAKVAELEAKIAEMEKATATANQVSSSGVNPSWQIVNSGCNYAVQQRSNSVEQQEPPMESNPD